MVSDTPKFRSLDLFSGIGGISLALQPWCETVCYCEIDPYAVGVLLKNMAEGYLDAAPIWSCVTTFGQSELDQVGPIDIICGGFPCQDLSVAGKGAGLSGARSGLFFEIVRIIRLARPRFVFLGNVPGLLVRGMDTVLRELAESGCDARWTVLGASDVGANHRRKRVWILGYNGDANSDYEHQIGTGEGFQPTAPASGSGSGERALQENVAHAQGKRLEGRLATQEQEAERLCGNAASGGKDVADAKHCGCEGGQQKWGRSVATLSSSHWSTEPNVGRVAHGVSSRVDRLRCLGNSVVPQCARAAFEMLMFGKE